MGTLRPSLDTRPSWAEASERLASSRLSTSYACSPRSASQSFDDASSTCIDTGNHLHVSSGSASPVDIHSPSFASTSSFVPSKTAARSDHVNRHAKQLSTRSAFGHQPSASVSTSHRPSRPLASKGRGLGLRWVWSITALPQAVRHISHFFVSLANPRAVRHTRTSSKSLSLGRRGRDTAKEAKRSRLAAHFRGACILYIAFSIFYFTRAMLVGGPGEHSLDSGVLPQSYLFEEHGVRYWHQRARLRLGGLYTSAALAVTKARGSSPFHIMGAAGDFARDEATVVNAEHPSKVSSVHRTWTPQSTLDKPMNIRNRC